MITERVTDNPFEALPDAIQDCEHCGHHVVCMSYIRYQERHESSQPPDASLCSEYVQDALLHKLTENPELHPKAVQFLQKQFSIMVQRNNYSCGIYVACESDMFRHHTRLRVLCAIVAEWIDRINQELRESNSKDSENESDLFHYQYQAGVLLISYKQSFMRITSLRDETWETSGLQYHAVAADEQMTSSNRMRITSRPNCIHWLPLTKEERAMLKICDYSFGFEREKNVCVIPLFTGDDNLFPS